ncbi:putative peptidyl-prolyl cis-trans isomerase [Leptospira sp. GIMC2001]|uniref:putative peptidyl-prolyl cis-trans isomerase n=1 Tax=Leptospira sp. GIMC2001 TaxID=1513297 RepID=UPI00234ABF42|nr:putative peptidyl-prolyl cis-trans isomerase [Leptospira sp. GIMC2001]WCL49652.1 putative peptidyl-prolyl cis-trans isomerase [Leptospira sp. GIMC2001]
MILLSKRIIYLFPIGILLLSGLPRTTEAVNRESLNQIIAIVGSKSLSVMDYEAGVERYKVISKFAPPTRKNQSFRSQVIDFLIDRAIVDIVAEEESIQVNEKRIEAEIDRRMEQMGITDLEQFKKQTAQQTGMSYEQWILDLPYQIKKGQLLQIRVTTPLPSEQEVRNWYNKNKGKVGFEVKFREIAIGPKDGSIDEESRVYKEVAEIRSNVLKDPSLFRLIASGPRNESRFKSSGGLVNWVPTFELYKQSPTLATISGQTKEGKISEIFRDERKRYCIIYVEGIRATPLDSVRRGVQNVLYRDKEQQAFENWLEQMRNQVTVTTYDPIYNREHNIKIEEEVYNLD